MPVTGAELQDRGKMGLEFYLKNKPIDQVAIERPLLKAMQGAKQSAPGAKQYIVEQLRYNYGSNFQWFAGSSIVTYNRRQSIEQANYAWRSAHDGFALDEDRLAANGIQITDDGKTSTVSDAEKIQLTNLFTEQSEILRNGFEEKMDQALHLDGTQSVDAMTGLDAMISLTPTTGTVGSINRATNVWWRNHAATGLTTTTTTGDILNKMEIAWRACVRNGGRPNLILAGEDFLDGYRSFLTSTYGRMDYGPAGFTKISGGTEMFSFHGVEMTWDPVFSDLDDLYGPGTTWKKRCYFINTKHLKLRPLEGQDMVTRKPPRAYDRYEFYWALTWRGAMTMNRSNAHAVLAIA